MRLDVQEPFGAKTIVFYLLFEVTIPCSIQYSAHDILGIRWSYCTGEMCCGSALELSSLNLGTDWTKRLDIMSKQDSAICLKNKSSSEAEGSMKFLEIHLGMVIHDPGNLDFQALSWILVCFEVAGDRNLRGWIF